MELDYTEDRFKLAEHAAVVVLLLEPVLAVLRRLAQENEARRRGVWTCTAEAADTHPGPIPTPIPRALFRGCSANCRRCTKPARSTGMCGLPT
ncbi:hypothetical protein ACFYY1_22855 [Streptomyces sp. NPDC001890]